MRESLTALSHQLAEIALRAAVPIREIYSRPFTAAEKSDGSPVTEADLAADALISRDLAAAFPDIPVISEESFSSISSLPERFFLVDPLDGTKEFIKKTGEFTVNIAYIENGLTKAGAIFAPALDALFIGGETAFWLNGIRHAPAPDLGRFNMLSTRKTDLSSLVALASLSHRDAITDSFLRDISPKDIKSSGSSYKFCVVAKGDADIYPRVGPTMGWDTAAGHAILQAAGGAVINAQGLTMTYRDPSLLNGPFLAVGDRRLLPELTPIFMKNVHDQHRAESDIAAVK
jgi:3'(2'), 5'-bisphosphate nucleotidase